MPKGAEIVKTHQLGVYRRTVFSDGSVETIQTEPANRVTARSRRSRCRVSSRTSVAPGQDAAQAEDGLACLTSRTSRGRRKGQEVVRYFTPPTAPLVPAAVRPRHPGFDLFKHYRPWDAGLNVFLLVDDTVTQSEPDGLSTVARTFHGGHIHQVSDREAELLIEAGYTVLGGPDPVVEPGLPGGDYGFRPPDERYADVYVDGYGEYNPAITNPASPPYVPEFGPGLPGGNYTSPQVGAGVYFDEYGNAYPEKGFASFDSSFVQTNAYGNTYTDVYGLVSEDNTP